jgi:hypothetical protein
MIGLTQLQTKIVYGMVALVIVCIILLCLQSSNKDSSEGFANAPTPSIGFCPMGYKPFHDKNGNQVCCDGKVVGNKCLGKPRCGQTTRAGLPTCTQMLKDYYATKSKDMCPPSMPNYFEGQDGTNAGCTEGGLTTDMTAPNLPSQKTCKVYATPQDNAAKTDSCQNQRQLERTPCFGKACHKSLSVQSDAGVALVQVEFTGADGHRHACYTTDSYTQFLDRTQPGWQTKGTFDPKKSLKICAVAKKVYVDRTMDEKDATH